MSRIASRVRKEHCIDLYSNEYDALSVVILAFFEFDVMLQNHTPERPSAPSTSRAISDKKVLRTSTPTDR